MNSLKDYNFLNIIVQKFSKPGKAFPIYRKPALLLIDQPRSE